MRQASYPKSKKSCDIHFILNSDDFNSSDIRKIGKYLKEQGVIYKYYRTYSDVKLMSWGVFRISIGYAISYIENENRTEKILNAVFG